jgi:2-polyprenyl-6-methoxyphenol hydroxylase-like FAD-dependent oxidoreductase
MPERHAEIAGAGFGGLAAAIALRQRGWSVRVHERSPEIRAHGSAIYLSENGLRVLESLGAYEAATRGAFSLRWRETRDAQGELVSLYDWNTEDPSMRQFMLLRKRAIEALADVARRSGVDLRTDSEAAEARPEGELVLTDGERCRADLVLVADGVNSRLLPPLGLLRSRRLHKDGSIRMLMPLEGLDWPEGVFTEYWSGRRRCYVVPCSETDLYLGFVALEPDEAARQVPIDRDLWARSFPAAAGLIRGVGDQERWSWDQYETVVLSRWRNGKVVVIGDAAHAMSPNFGQGGALTMGSALTLASLLSEHPFEAAVDAWEARERPVVENTQRLSALYSTFMSWPEWPRTVALKAMGRSRWVMRQRTLAAYHRPIGTVERPAA